MSFGGRSNSAFFSACRRQCPPRGARHAIARPPGTGTLFCSVLEFGPVPTSPTPSAWRAAFTALWPGPQLLQNTPPLYKGRPCFYKIRAKVGNFYARSTLWRWGLGFGRLGRPDQTRTPEAALSAFIYYQLTPLSSRLPYHERQSWAEGRS